MKRLIYLNIVLSVLLLSCEKNPEAHFSVESVKPEVGQGVLFKNDSHNATKFEWDFGDGFISNDENPIHIYTGTGPVEVTLKAISKNGLSDKASLKLDVMIPTLLEIEVREFYDKYAVQNADVYIYSKISDWDAHNDNFISVGKTDKNGLVVFSGLDPFLYYVDVDEKDHDNRLLRNDNIDFVRTSEIIPNQINRFIAWVDFYSKRKEKTGNTTIKRLERKATGEYQTYKDSGTQGWQEVFDRRTGKK